MTANGYRGAFRGEENIVKLDCGRWLRNSVTILKKPLNCVLKMGELYGILMISQKSC